jgi:hypothetical protein
METEDEKVSRNMRTELVVFGGTALLAATLLAVGAFMAALAHDVEDDYWALLEEHADLLDLGSESLRSQSA